MASVTPAIVHSGTYASYDHYQPLGYTEFLYAYPSEGASTPAFANLISLKETYPSVPIIVIVNNDNGAGASQDPNFVSAINGMRAAGITVLGYVYCDLGYNYPAASRNLTGSDPVQGVSDFGRGLEQAIDTWASFYTIDGIFFDNAVPGPGNPAANDLASSAPGWSGHTILQYYQEATNYAKTTYGYTFVMDNVGAVYPSMIGAADSLTLEDENGFLPTPATLGSWTTGQGGTAADFNLIDYKIAAVPNVSYLTSIRSYVSFVSITNTNGPPTVSYQDALLANLDQLSSGVTARAYPSEYFTNTGTVSGTTTGPSRFEIDFWAYVPSMENGATVSFPSGSWASFLSVWVNPGSSENGFPISVDAVPSGGPNAEQRTIELNVQPLWTSVGGPGGVSTTTGSGVGTVDSTTTWPLNQWFEITLDCDLNPNGISTIYVLQNGAQIIAWSGDIGTLGVNGPTTYNALASFHPGLYIGGGMGAFGIFNDDFAVYSVSGS
jgi:hypothetical protein